MNKTLEAMRLTLPEWRFESRDFNEQPGSFIVATRDDDALNTLTKWDCDILCGELERAWLKTAHQYECGCLVGEKFDNDTPDGALTFMWAVFIKGYGFEHQGDGETKLDAYLEANLQLQEALGNMTEGE